MWKPPGATTDTPPGGGTGGTEYGTGFVALRTYNASGGSVWTAAVGDTTWAEWAGAIADDVVGITSSPGRMVASGFDCTYYADDPYRAWTKGYSGNSDFFDVLYNGSKFVAVGQGGYMTESADGVTWSVPATSLAGTSTLNGLGWDGTYWYAAGVGEIYRCLDADTASPWTKVASSLGIEVQGVSHNGSTYMAWGVSFDELVLISSPDGETWTKQPTLTGVSPGFGNRGYTGVGPGGFVLSSNGSTAPGGPVFVDNPSTSSHAVCVKSDGTTRLNPGSDYGWGNAVYDGVRWRMLGGAEDGVSAGVYMWVSDDGIVWSEHSLVSDLREDATLLGYDAPLYPLAW